MKNKFGIDALDGLMEKMKDLPPRPRVAFGAKSLLKFPFG